MAFLVRIDATNLSCIPATLLEVSLKRMCGAAIGELPERLFCVNLVVFSCFQETSIIWRPAATFLWRMAFFSRSAGCFCPVKPGISESKNLALGQADKQPAREEQKEKSGLFLNF